MFLNPFSYPLADSQFQILEILNPLSIVSQTLGKHPKLYQDSLLPEDCILSHSQGVPFMHPHQEGISEAFRFLSWALFVTSPALLMKELEYRNWD